MIGMRSTRGEKRQANKTNEEKILDILASMSLRMDSMEAQMAAKDGISKIDVRIETEITSKLDALAEGHAAILEQPVPITRVGETETASRCWSPF